MFEVPQRWQLASVRAPLSLFAPVSSTVSCVPPPTRNLSPADPFPTPSKELGTGNALLWYGICVPCAKQAPMVRDAFSEAFGVKNRLFRYGRDIRCKKQAPGVPNEISDARFLHCNQQFRGKWDTFCVLPPRFHRVLKVFAPPAC